MDMSRSQSSSSRLSSSDQTGTLSFSQTVCHSVSRPYTVVSLMLMDRSRSELSRERCQPSDLRPPSQSGEGQMKMYNLSVFILTWDLNVFFAVFEIQFGGQIECIKSGKSLKNWLSIRILAFKLVLALTVWSLRHLTCNHYRILSVNNHNEFLHWIAIWSWLWLWKSETEDITAWKAQISTDTRDNKWLKFQTNCKNTLFSFTPRKELQTYQTQSVDAGFSISGVSTSVSVRRTVNSSNYTISYSPQENKFVMNHTEPQSNNVGVKWFAVNELSWSYFSLDGKHIRWQMGTYRTQTHSKAGLAFQIGMIFSRLKS